MTPKTHSHLRVVAGEGQLTAEHTTAEKHARIRLSTIFIEDQNRKKWIYDAINAFWQTHAAQLTHLVSQGSENTENTVLATISIIRTSFLMARKIPATAALIKFLDSLALLAYHSYRQIAQKTIEMRSADYNRAYTSTDMYTENTDSNNPTLRSADELAKLISNKHFNLDTSLFEKEIAEASVAATKPNSSNFQTPLSSQDLYQYLLVLFTAFNQKKAISYPQS